MIKNIKKGLITLSTFIIGMSTPALAANTIPNMQLVAESSISMQNQNINSLITLWYSDKKVRAEVEMLGMKNGAQNFPAGMSKSIIILDSNKKIGYMLTPSVKSAIKMDMATMAKMQGASGGSMPSMDLNSKMITDPGQIKEELKKSGAKMVGAETVLGHLCDIWQTNQNIPTGQGTTENATVKFWLANKLGIPLKMEITTPQKGKVFSLKAKEVKTDGKIDASLFEVPKDYKISDMQQMFNQINSQMKNKTKGN